MKSLDETSLRYVVGVLAKEITIVEAQLSILSNSKASILLLNQLDALKLARKMLSKCAEYQVVATAAWHKIPMPQHQFSEYRLVEDFDTDDRANWKELASIRPSGGAILID